MLLKFQPDLASLVAYLLLSFCDVNFFENIKKAIFMKTLGIQKEFINHLADEEQDKNIFITFSSKIS